MDDDDYDDNRMVMKMICMRMVWRRADGRPHLSLPAAFLSLVGYIACCVSVHLPACIVHIALCVSLCVCAPFCDCLDVCLCVLVCALLCACAIACCVSVCLCVHIAHCMQCALSMRAHACTCVHLLNLQCAKSAYCVQYAL